MSANFPNLPKAIEIWLHRHDQSQADLARLLDVSKATVTRWMQGEEPEVKRLRDIAKTLGVTVGYLADEDDIAHDDEERQLLKKYRQASPGVRKAMNAIAEIPGDYSPQKK